MPGFAWFLCKYGWEWVSASLGHSIMSNVGNDSTNEHVAFQLSRKCCALSWYDVNMYIHIYVYIYIHIIYIHTYLIF